MHDSENYFDQEITFTHEGQDYLWTGDYLIESLNEEEGEFAPAFGDFEVKITYTSSLMSYKHGIDFTPTPSLLMALELEIERNH